MGRREGQKEQGNEGRREEGGGRGEGGKKHMFFGWPDNPGRTSEPRMVPTVHVHVAGLKLQPITDLSGA